MLEQITAANRVKGCFVGLAVGDVLGAPVEGFARNTFPRVTQMLSMPFGEFRPGDDTDTTAAITGQMAGAYYGYESIPKEWVATLCNREDIERCAISLLKVKPVILKTRDLEKPYKMSLPNLGDLIQK